MNSSISVKDDFYEAINKGWLASTELPGDKPSFGSFTQVDDDNEKKLLADFKLLLEDLDKADTPELKEFGKFYRLALDFKRRDSEGVQPLLSVLARIENLESLADFNQQLVDLIFEGFPKPFEIVTLPDFKDTTQHVIFLGAPDLLLPDPSYYEEKSERKEKLLGVFRKMVQKLLKIAGKDDVSIERLISDYLEFDRSLVPYVKTNEESAEILNSYHPVSLAEFSKKVRNVPFADIIEKLVGERTETVVDSELRFFVCFDALVSEATFPRIKSWLYIKTLIANSDFLSEKIRLISGEFVRTLSGQPKARSQEKHAFAIARNFFAQVVGVYYGQNYLGEKAKKDVENMVQNVLAVYKERLSNNDWLTETTSRKAILKLENLGVFIGYPDKIEDIYQKFIVDPDQSFLENARKFIKLKIKRKFDEYSEPVDRKRWHVHGYMVNACFDPTMNQISFPAGILQTPFYNEKQSSSQNYGGIGAVIAHEISHAFDNNGSQFDEHGNLNTWWTDDDFKAFEKKQQEVIEEFDGISVDGGVKTNGKLTVSENIADTGGIMAALIAAKKETDVNLREFFINWATLWRTLIRPEFQELLSNIDVHAPSKLRVNIQVANFSEFYEAFDVGELDQMYRKPSERVITW